MADEIELDISSFKREMREVQQALSNLPVKIGRRVMRRAITSAIRGPKAAAKRNIDKTTGTFARTIGTRVHMFKNGSGAGYIGQSATRGDWRPGRRKTTFKHLRGVSKAAEKAKGAGRGPTVRPIMKGKAVGGISARRTGNVLPDHLYLFKTNRHKLASRGARRFFFVIPGRSKAGRLSKARTNYVFRRAINHPGKAARSRSYLTAAEVAFKQSEDSFFSHIIPALKKYAVPLEYKPGASS